MRQKGYLLYWFAVITLIGLSQLFPNDTVAIGADIRGAYAKDGELSDVNLTFFSPQGERLYYLESATLGYFTEQRKIQLDPLRIIYMTPTGVLITLESDAGEALEAGTLVELQGKVYINKLASADLPVQSVETSYLTIDTVKRMATTNQHASLRSGNRIFNGEGMEIDLLDGKIRLLKNVKTQDVQK